MSGGMCNLEAQIVGALQAGAEACRISGYDAPRLLSLLHLAQLLSIKAASNMSTEVQQTAAGELTSND
jgi:hypothetical protein